MHAVGDVADRVLLGRDLRPEVLQQLRDDTPPWMRETPLWKREPRMASAVMLKSSLAGVRPSASSVAASMPTLAAERLEVVRDRSRRAKWSWPAGTGVCVVNTVFAATASSAASNAMPSRTSARTRSSTRNAAWPSLMCQTVGS